MAKITNPHGIPDEELMREQRELLYPELTDPPRIPFPGGNVDVVAYNLALLGLDDQRIADVLCEGDVGVLQHWCKLFHGFAGQIERGRLLADAEVAAALFNRAKGYELDDVRRRYIIKDDGTEKLVGYERRTVHVPASVDAIELWLKTRQPVAWPLKPIPPEDRLPGDPQVGEDDINFIIRRLESLRDRKQQGAGGDRADPEGPVD